MKRSLLTLACTLIASTSAAAPPRSTFRYTAPKDEERPVIADALIAPQGSDFAMRLRFDKEPWGEQCKTHCANAIVLLDTDANTTTGIQLGKNHPETGADMAVIIQGVREYKGTSSSAQLRVKVRQLTGESKSVEDGDALADLNNHQDPERIQLDENTVYLLIDATGPTLPSARKVRVIYHPPAAKPLQATIAGTLSGGSSSGVRIFRGSGTSKGWGKAKEAGTRLDAPPKTGDNHG
ncbi:MAG: hypothetical protein ACJ8AT_20865 [Hyalangium sp.]|uniref:hypothetical protein n=1 Tax=Hyalangium sp. TaxID=2028555 RepID=UPI00389A72B3